MRNYPTCSQMTRVDVVHRPTGLQFVVWLRLSSVEPGYAHELTVEAPPGSDIKRVSSPVDPWRRLEVAGDVIGFHVEPTAKLPRLWMDVPAAFDATVVDVGVRFPDRAAPEINAETARSGPVCGSMRPVLSR